MGIGIILVDQGVVRQTRTVPRLRRAENPVRSPGGGEEWAR